MNAYTLTLADPQAALENTGGKGMSLARMIQAGLPVPGGFHVTTAAYRRFVDDNHLQDRIQAALAGANAADPAVLEAVSSAIQADFAAGQMPAEVAQAVAAAYAGMGSGAVAVRSSATAEDLPDASFAGQQETYLNIQGREAVLEAVQKCWASLWTARAIAYRLNNQIDQAAVALAVVVQELVNAEAAGILFTANPVTGSRAEMLVNAAWGLGEAVVSGAVSPDTLTVSKPGGRVLQQEIGEKLVMTVRTREGTREMPVPPELRKKPALTSAQAAELARLAARIEQFYGLPMDVEWALAGGKFAILQARPITAMPPDWTPPTKQALYARGSLAEHIPSPVTPLFATFGLELANQATLEMWQRVIGPASQEMFVGDGFYQPINGYIFGGISTKPRILFSLTVMSFKQTGPMLRRSVERWQEARQKLAAVVAAWEPRPLEDLPADELLDGIRAVFLAACRYFTDIQTCLPAASSSEVLFNRLYNSLIRRKDDPAASAFLLGFESAALQAEKSLYALSGWIKTQPGLVDWLLQAPTGSLAESYLHGEQPAGAPQPWPELAARLDKHLQAFGRTAYEFDFAYPTPQETPGPLFEALKGFLSGQAQDPNLRQQESARKREALTQAVQARTGWPRRGWFLRVLRWAQETAPMREDSIFDMGMGHPLLRRMFAELGGRLAAAGGLRSADEIYWLEKTELEQAVQQLMQGGALEPLYGPVEQRKARWQAYRKTTAPVMIPERSGWNKLIHGGEAQQKDGKVVLKGVGTSSGKVTAPARVLLGPEDFSRLQPGDVLVAVTTTPAWTPLFGLASAVVTDIGGPLSHSSIVAREFGIPAVMAARGATRLIKDGQMVTVDGATGKVTVE